MVFYRTYRPQTIAQLDSPDLRSTLTAVLSSKNVPHAFLFTGPKGLGKTSTARIIAKILNCTGSKRNGIEPCNECDQCVSITNGNNVDVLEIDGASNRGIDEIRDLKEKINLAPVKAAKKVYIIDEVHMLTTEAFNALLKTIEEPPAHVVFIFATTEPQKVPATIMSRCFHISLKKATKEEIVHALTRIVKEEKIDIDDEALGSVAEMGDGGYRDATKIFEELVALANGKKITKEFINEKLQISGAQFAISPSFAELGKTQPEAKKILLMIQDLVNQGIDMRYFLSQCLEALHDSLLMKMGVLESSKYQLSPDMFESEQQIALLVQLFSEAYQQTKYAVIPSLPLELAVVTWCQNNDVISSSEEKAEEDLSAPLRDDNKTPRVVENKPSLHDVIKKEQNLKVKQVLSGGPAKPAPKAAPSHTQENLPKDAKDLQNFTENVIYKVKSYNHSVAGVLRGCGIRSVSDTQVVFEAAYAFHKEKLDEPKTRDILEQVVREITGKDLQVVVELKK